MLALETIALNIDMACDNEAPICQDTGMPTFEIKTPIGVNQLVMKGAIHEAIAEATKLGKLRPNSVDSLTGKNSGNNLGQGTPVIHFEQWERDDIEVRLILKGGGCENKNIQYSLPMELEHLGRADRNLEGVRKCILHAVWQAQGHGCSIGAIGVAIGGDRASGYHYAKQQLFRTLDDINPESRPGEAGSGTSCENANKLGIGTMGFGGEATLIGCKVGAYHRLPASFFVSVAYDCWAFRRLGVVSTRGPERSSAGCIATTRRQCAWRRTQGFRSPDGRSASRPRSRRNRSGQLKVGDVVLLNGMLYTGTGHAASSPPRPTIRRKISGARRSTTAVPWRSRRARSGSSMPPVRPPAAGKSRTRPTSSRSSASGR